MLKKLLKLNKFYLSEFNFTEKNDYFNIIINIFFTIKFLINSLLKLFIISDIEVKKIFFKKKIIIDNIKKFDECFIISSGPSINFQDLEKLKSKNTFVSNDFHLHKDCKIVNPNFYCLLDGGCFNPTLNRDHITKENKLDERIFARLEKINKERSESSIDSTFIFPLQAAKKSVEKYNFFENRKIIYLNMLSFDMADYIPKNLEISAGIPFSFNVLPWKICIAILMGFKKIYLIGAEQDMYITDTHFISGNDRQKDYLHAFGLEYKKEKNLYPNTTNYISMHLTKQILKSHINLNRFALTKNAKIINLTPGGILDIYENEKYENVV